MGNMFKRSLLIDLLMTIYLVLILLSQEISLMKIIGTTTLPSKALLIWLPVVIVSFTNILFSKRKWLANAVLATIATGLLVGDFLYFSFFDTLPTLSSRIPFNQAFAVKDSLIFLFNLRLLMWLLMLVPIWIMGFWYAKNAPIKNHFGYFLTAKIFGLLCFIGTFGYINYILGNTLISEKTHHSDQARQVPIAMHWGARFSNLNKARVLGVFSYHIVDFTRFIKNNDDLVIDENQFRLVASELDKRHNKYNTKTSLFGIAKDYNVIMVQLEAFQYFLVDQHYNNFEVTPFLNSLYRDALHWEHIYDNTYLGRTSDAEFAIQTGLYPDKDNLAAFNHIGKDLFRFPHKLREKGYATSSYHGYVKDFWNRTNTHPYYGFEKMFFKEDLPFEDKLGLGIPDHQLLPYVADDFKNYQQPFYSWILSLSSHYPFTDQPDSTEGLFEDLYDVSNMFIYADYMKLAHYTDQTIQDFTERLRENGLLDNSILIFYGDHDMGKFNAFTNAALVREVKRNCLKILGTFPQALNEDRVPLAIWVPSKTEEINNFVSQNPDYSKTIGSLSDVFPTIFHLLGLETPRSIMGSHLLQEKNQTVLSGGILDGETKRYFTTAVDNSGVFAFSLQGGVREFFPFDENTPKDDNAIRKVSGNMNGIRFMNKVLLSKDYQKQFTERPKAPK